MSTHGVVCHELSGCMAAMQAGCPPLLHLTRALGRWIAEVSGDLRVGGTVRAVFTSTLTGPARIDSCDAPHHLLARTVR